MPQALGYVFWFLAIVAFVFELWALFDAVRTPANAYTAADKQNKNLWLILLSVATVVGLGGAANVLSVLSILPVAAFIVAGVYLADVRPAVRPYRGKGRSGNSGNGPYGPW